MYQEVVYPGFLAGQASDNVYLEAIRNVVANDNHSASFILWKFVMLKKLAYALGYCVGSVKGLWREKTSNFQSPPTYRGGPNAPLPDVVLDDNEFTNRHPMNWSSAATRSSRPKQSQSPSRSSRFTNRDYSVSQLARFCHRNTHTPTRRARSGSEETGSLSNGLLLTRCKSLRFSWPVPIWFQGWGGLISPLGTTGHIGIEGGVECVVSNWL